MAETSRQLAQISIDLKKSRIRVHKASLHQIGDPHYIHLLVNIEARQVAIRSVDAQKFDSAAHKVKPSAMDSDFSYETYWCCHPGGKDVCLSSEFYPPHRE